MGEFEGLDSRKLGFDEGIEMGRRKKGIIEHEGELLGWLDRKAPRGLVGTTLCGAVHGAHLGVWIDATWIIDTWQAGLQLFCHLCAWDLISCFHQ